MKTTSITGWKLERARENLRGKKCWKAKLLPLWNKYTVAKRSENGFLLFFKDCRHLTRGSLTCCWIFGQERVIWHNSNRLMVLWKVWKWWRYIFVWCLSSFNTTRLLSPSLFNIYNCPVILCNSMVWHHYDLLSAVSLWSAVFFYTGLQQLCGNFRAPGGSIESPVD